MRKLFFLIIIIAVLIIFFVVSLEKKEIAKGSEVVPGGTDIPKLIINKAKDFLPVLSNSRNILSNGSQNLEISEMVDKIKDNLTANVASQVTNFIKNPVKDKINEFICPTIQQNEEQK